MLYVSGNSVSWPCAFSDSGVPPMQGLQRACFPIVDLPQLSVLKRVREFEICITTILRSVPDGQAIRR